MLLCRVAGEGREGHRTIGSYRPALVRSWTVDDLVREIQLPLLSSNRLTLDARAGERVESPPPKPRRTSSPQPNWGVTPFPFLVTESPLTIVAVVSSTIRLGNPLLNITYLAVSTTMPVIRAHPRAGQIRKERADALVRTLRDAHGPELVERYPRELAARTARAYPS